MGVKTLEDEVIERIISIWLKLFFGINRSKRQLGNSLWWSLYIINSVDRKNYFEINRLFHIGYHYSFLK